MIRVSQTDLLVGHQTHEGESGKNNEDNYTVVAFKPAAKGQTMTTLAVVADGVGGNQAGEVASEMVVNAIVETFTHADPAADPKSLFIQGYAAAQKKLIAHAEQNPNIQNMSTTMVTAAVVNRRLYIAWLGDSRIYLLRNGQIRQLTIDHTVLQDAVDRGILTPEQAKESNIYQHVIQRYISTTSDVMPDLRLRLNPTETKEQSEANQGLPLNAGDQILLCSDGLHDLVEDHEIAAEMEKHATPQEAVETLVMMARQRGGHDNITIALLKVPEDNGQLARTGLFAGAAFASVLTAILAVILVAALLFWGYTALIRKDPTPTPAPIPPSPTATIEPTATQFIPPTQPESPSENEMPPDTAEPGQGEQSTGDETAPPQETQTNDLPPTKTLSPEQQPPNTGTPGPGNTPTPGNAPPPTATLGGG